MQSMTIRLPDRLMNWLKEQARRGKRTKNKQVELLLEQLWQQDIDREIKEELERNNG